MLGSVIVSRSQKVDSVNTAARFWFSDVERLGIREIRWAKPLPAFGGGAATGETRNKDDGRPVFLVASILFSCFNCLQRFQCDFVPRLSRPAPDSSID